MRGMAVETAICRKKMCMPGEVSEILLTREFVHLTHGDIGAGVLQT